MEDVFDSRLDCFLEWFSQNKFKVQKSKGISCPYILLPGDWHRYLQDYLSSATRQSLTCKFRRFESLTEFCVIEVETGNVNHQIEILLTLWQMRWGAELEYVLNWYRAIFQSCFENNCLWLTILWDGRTPVAGMAAFVDQKKKTFRFYITGFDDKFAKLSPGKVMVGYSIRYAIENGFQVYDFLRESERYKSSF